MDTNQTHIERLNRILQSGGYQTHICRHEKRLDFRGRNLSGRIRITFGSNAILELDASADKIIAITELLSK